MVSDYAIPGSAKITIDKRDQISAAIDIFLDIAMFNSISFLREMTINEKQNFGKKKLQYFWDSRHFKDREIYYHIDKNNPPEYFSFAFSARTGPKQFDCFRYVSIWDNYLRENFSELKNENINPIEQIKKHRDYDNIDARYKSNDYWKDKKGDYLLLRINRSPNDGDREAEFITYFGTSPIHDGIIKVVSISEYFNQWLKKQIDELYISAFKIVC